MEKNVLKLTVKASASAPPDTVKFTFFIRGDDRVYSYALEKMNRITEKLRKILAKVAIPPEALKTSEYRISELSYTVYEENQKREAFWGFRAEQELILRMAKDQEKLKKVLDALVTSQVNVPFRLSFELRDEESLRMEAYRKALARARKLAETLAREAGLVLGEILSIETDWREEEIAPPFILREETIAARRIPVDLEPEAIKVEGAVTVKWELRRK
ncbi:MAG: SIMPL domain-containing protein [Thermodesulfobacteria bacterium]|nr:SIMPL domain-containing protein [Thermodesulfobacteriota bacterium]